MERRTWKILTVVFAGAGVMMLAMAYLPQILAMDVNTYIGDADDGYIMDGEPQPSNDMGLIVSMKDGSVVRTSTSFLYFDTSPIPDNAEITSAKLKLYVYMTAQSTMPMILCYDPNGVYPHKPYRQGDEQTSHYAGVPVTLFWLKGAEWRTIDVPTKWINKEGWTKLALFAGYRGTWIMFLSADTRFPPKLEITYTIPQYHLTVKTNPSYCDVTVAGETKNSGTTGATFYLPQGTYKVTVSKEGYVTETKTIYLDRDKTITVTLEPEVHEYTLTVYTSPAYCNVEVTDGDTWSANSGADGECKFTLEEGMYHVTVSKEGYKAQTQTVNLNSNKAVSFNLEPEVKEYVLTVYVDPIGATVEVAGQTKIVPSTGYVDFILEEGEYTVTIYKDGYDTVTRQINLNQNMELHISLTPQRPDVAITHYMNIIGLTMILLAVPCGVKGWL